MFSGQNWYSCMAPSYPKAEPCLLRAKNASSAAVHRGGHRFRTRATAVVLEYISPPSPSSACCSASHSSSASFSFPTALRAPKALCFDVAWKWHAITGGNLTTGML